MYHFLLCHTACPVLPLGPGIPGGPTTVLTSPGKPRSPGFPETIQLQWVHSIITTVTNTVNNLSTSSQCEWLCMYCCTLRAWQSRDASFSWKTRFSINSYFSRRSKRTRWSRQSNLSFYSFRTLWASQTWRALCSRPPLDNMKVYLKLFPMKMQTLTISPGIPGKPVFPGSPGIPGLPTCPLSPKGPGNPGAPWNIIEV